MSLQTYYLNKSSFQDAVPLVFDIPEFPRSSSVFLQNSSTIDLTIPGNRLFQKKNGEIILIPKTPGEVIGERILRPLIDGVYSLTSHLFSRFPDSSSFSTSFLNFRWSSGGTNIDSLGGDKSIKEEDVSNIHSLRDQVLLSSSEKLDRFSQHDILTKCKDLPDFDTSEMSITKAMLAIDNLLARFIQLVPVAAAQHQIGNGELVLHGISEPPLSLDEMIALLENVKTCVDYVKEMPADEGFKFAENYALIQACNGFAQQRNNVMLALIERVREYIEMKEEILDNCLGVLRAKKLFEKERELLEQGKTSLFSKSGSARKQFLLRTPQYSHYHTLETWSFKDLTQCEEVFLDVDVSREEANHQCNGEDSDRIFSESQRKMVKLFHSFSLDDSPSITQMVFAFNAESIQQLRQKSERILEEMRRVKLTSLDGMMQKQQQIEKEIEDILKDVCDITRDASAICEEPKGSVNYWITSFTALIAISMSISLYQYIRNEHLKTLLEQLSSKIITLSCSVNHERRLLIADRVDQELAFYRFSIDRERIIEELKSIMNSQDEHQIYIRGILRNLNLEQLSSEIITLLSSWNHNRRPFIDNQFNRELGSDRLSIDRESIITELDLIMRLRDEHQIRNELRNLGLEQLYWQVRELSREMNNLARERMVDLLDRRLGGTEFFIDRECIISQFELIIHHENVHQIQIRGALRRLGLEQFSAHVIELSGAVDDDRRRSIVNLFDRKLATTRFSIDREHRERVILELELIILLEDPGKIKEKLRNLGFEACKIFRNVLTEITQRDGGIAM